MAVTFNGKRIPRGKCLPLRRGNRTGMTAALKELRIGEGKIFSITKRSSAMTCARQIGIKVECKKLRGPWITVVRTG